MFLQISYTIPASLESYHQEPNTSLAICYLKTLGRPTMPSDVNGWFVNGSRWNQCQPSKDAHKMEIYGGGGVLVFFWQILLKGVLGVVRKSGGVVLDCILCGSLSKIFIGVHEVPPSPPPPVCIYAAK